MMDNESITMKIEVKDELFNEDFDVSEKVGIELITSKEFDQNHILNVSNHTQKSSSMSVIIEPFASTSSSTSEIPKSKLPNFSIFQKAFSNHTQKCSSVSDIIEPVASASHSTSEIPETKASKRDMNGEKEYFDLPYGWTKQVVYLRNQPSMKGKVRTDIYLTSPGSPSVKRKWIQSDIQLQKYLAENPNVKCDQSVTTTSRKKHREFLEELKKKSLTRGILEESKEINRKRSNLINLDSRETSISKRIQTEDNTLVDKSKSYVHKSDERSELSHESMPEEMEEAYNDASMNDSKLESSRLSQQDKLSYDSTKFQCSFCDSNYSQKTNLYHHVREKHKKEDYNNWKSSIICETAKEKFRQKGNWKFSSRNVSAKSFECPYCDYKCSQKCNLYHHVKKKHAEDYNNWKSSIRKDSANLFQCPYCDSNYSQKCNLYKHVKKKHAEDHNKSKSSIRKISTNSFQCPYCDSNYSQKCNLYHHVKQKHQENYDNWKLTKSKFYVSNYDRNQSLWKIYGENQDIPEWSICLDCVPHKVLKDGDDSMDKHFAENPEHYQINPAWFYLKFNLYVSDIAKQQKYKAIIKSSIICETDKEKFSQKIQVQNVAP